MAYKLIDFFAGRIDSPYLVASLLSLIPGTEIKGSILYVVSSGANVWLAALSAYLPSIALALLHAAALPPLFRLLDKHPRCRKCAGLVTDRIAKAADKILKSTKDEEIRAERLFLGVYTFVAIPLPLTGIWAGGILAAMLGLDFKRTVFALSAGNFTAGGIVLAVALLAGDYASAVLDVFCIFVLLFLLVPIVKKAIKSRSRRGYKYRRPEVEDCSYHSRVTKSRKS